MALQVVTNDNFSNASQQEIDLIKGAATKWAFAEDGVALRTASFVQNKLAQLLAALASVCPPCFAVYLCTYACNESESALFLHMHN